MAAKWLALLFLIQHFAQQITEASKVRCIHNGKEYHPGKKITKACNKCYCLQNGDWFCTKRVCRLTDFKGIEMTPSNDVTISRGSKVNVICRSERKRSRFMWFMNGQLMTSRSKISTFNYGASVLRLNARDLERESTYVTCFVPPFTPKRIKIINVDQANLPNGMPKITSQPKIIESSPNYGVDLKCKSDGRQPMQVTWFKFGAPLHSDNPVKWIVTPDGTLMILTPVKSDSGLYECMVTNDVGAAMTSQPTQLIINKGLAINGGWCGWKRSTACNASCGGGSMRFTRDCACPPPENSGTDCKGPKEKFEECNTQKCHKELFGKVRVNKMEKKDIAKGSCLHVGFIPESGCNEEKNCHPSSVLTLRDFKIHQGNGFNYVEYSMMLPDSLTGKYKLGALVQMGHCQEKLTAYKMFKKNCMSSSADRKQDFNASPARINKDVDAMYEEKLQSINGIIKFRPNLERLPDNSCLRLLIWSDVKCHGPVDCKPVQTINIARPVMKNSIITFETRMPFALDARLYLVEGIVNIGWCQRDSEKEEQTGKGDYMSLKKKPLFVGESVLSYNIDLTLDKIKGNQRKRDLSLSGSFMLRDYTKTKIPAQSCLTVELKEIYSCNEEEGCRNPYISETRIDVANQEMFRVGKQSFKTPYGALFRNVVGSKFEVRAILNVGWCRHYVKGKRRTRPNDYWTNQVYELSFDEKEDDAYLHLEMSKVEKSLGWGSSTIRGEIQYKSGLSSKLNKNSCVRLMLAKKICESDKTCKKVPFLTYFIKNIVPTKDHTIPFKIIYRSGKKFQELYAFAVMNINWCSEGETQEQSLWPEDLIAAADIKTQEDFVRIKMKKQTQLQFVDAPFKKAELQKGSTELKVSLDLPSDEDISSSSCLIATVHEGNACKNKSSCPREGVAKEVFRDLVKSKDNSVEVDMTLKPALVPNAKYQFDFVLNNGWCSEGATNASWIKNGDFFTSYEHEFGNDTASDVIDNVALKIFKDDDEKAEKCNIKCPRILDPVCGSDNRTYNSLCVLKREACIFDSGVTLLHKGECERCKRGCSTKIKPICARNGKTYDNLCIMERDACFEDVFLTFRHRGKCESVTMRGDVRFSLDKPLPDVTSGSCLVIKTRKAVYCKFPERCPDFELAEVVLKDVVIPSDGKVPYEIVMNPRPMSSVYLVEAVLNRGWCSVDTTSKEWIRNEDYFNINEQPFAVEGTEEIYKDISIGKLVNLKVIEKGTIPSAIRDPCSIIECPHHGTCHVVNGKGVCQCKLFCPLDAKPVCGSNGNTYANECILKSESCVSKKTIKIEHKGPCEKSLRISGDILIDKIIPRVPIGSCLTVTVTGKCNKGEEKCEMNRLAMVKQRHVFIPPSNRIYYQLDIKPRPKPGIYVILAVLNRGWCARNSGRTEWIRIGDYFNNFMTEIEISESGNIEKDVVIVKFDSKNVENDHVIVKGEVLLDETDAEISNGSCMSISLHRENKSCLKECVTQPVIRFYVKNLTSLQGNKIPYQAVIKPRPKPGSYVLSVILNRGWCSDGSSELIRDGDLFISEGRKLEIGLGGDITKDVNITKYYPPGLPCMMQGGKKVPNGGDVNGNGNGCHGCKCNNGSITCKPTVCPSIDCNNGFLSIEDGDCCPTCIKYAKCHDSKSGKMYKNREAFFNREKEYCETCTCNMTGKFSCSKEVCPKLDCKKPIYIGSSCCPVCASDIRCKDQKTGMLYKAGETWVNGEVNGCSKCKCVTKSGSKSLGFIECIKPSCPRLNCVQQVYPKGYCCPVCLKEKSNGPFKEADVSYLQALIFNEVVSSEVSCTDTADGKIYAEGEKWSRNCSNYECRRSGIASMEKDCPYLTCPRKYQKIKPGECCPSCTEECLPKLLCTSDAVILVVPKIFLPYARPTELVFNNCTSVCNSTHFILKTGLNQCGMKRSIEGEFMKYSNMAFTREDENAVISRVQLVQIPVACIYPALTRSILSREFIKRNRGISVVNPVPKNTGPVKAFDVFMKVSDENGVEHKSGKAIKFDPGEKVIVEIGGTGLVENKIKVKADYCYLTPTPAPQSLVNYTLIKNGCAVDSTVEFEESNGNGQRFSFRALVFTKTKVPGFYLHCDTVTCDAEDPECTTGCRQRRAIYQNEANLITREKAADHKRKMKLTLHVVLG